MCSVLYVNYKKTFLKKKDFFWRGRPFLKLLLNLLQYCFWFMFWTFSSKACGILVQGLNPNPLHWKAKS